jgi:hypothetical protein
MMKPKRKSTLNRDIIVFSDLFAYSLRTILTKHCRLRFWRTPYFDQIYATPHFLRLGDLNNCWGDHSLKYSDEP